MKENLKTILAKPLVEFINRCTSIYKLGRSDTYTPEVFRTKKKFCFNPYVSTECDVQIKLGGVIEEHFRINNLPYTVNAEMKVYNLPVRNQRADLSIHNLPDSGLYLDADAHNQSLKAVIEIKYANAIHPNHEFKNGSIERDIAKLAGLNDGILKILLLIDEANKIDEIYIDKLLKDCKANNIELLSNNNIIYNVFTN